MTIIEKFELLSPQQQQQTLLAIQKFGLDAFLADIGGEMTAEEKAAARDYFQATKVELSDEEMEAATGGAGFKLCPKGHFQIYFQYGSAGDCVFHGCEYYIMNCVSSNPLRCTYYCSYFNVYM